jgi:hypothetical protein
MVEVFLPVREDYLLSSLCLTCYFTIGCEVKITLILILQ